MSDYVSVLQNKTLRIVTIQEPPFIMFKHDNYDKNNIKPTDIEGRVFDIIRHNTQLDPFM